MAIRQAAVLARAPNAGLAAAGEFWGSFAAFVPDLKAAIAAADATFGLAMMATAPAVMARLGRHGLAVAGLILAGAFLGLLLPRGPVGLALAMAALMREGRGWSSRWRRVRPSPSSASG